MFSKCLDVFFQKFKSTSPVCLFIGALAELCSICPLCQQKWHHAAHDSDQSEAIIITKKSNHGTNTAEKQTNKHENSLLFPRCGGFSVTSTISSSCSESELATKNHMNAAAWDSIEKKKHYSPPLSADIVCCRVCVVRMFAMCTHTLHCFPALGRKSGLFRGGRTTSIFCSVLSRKINYAAFSGTYSNQPRTLTIPQLHIGFSFESSG